MASENKKRKTNKKNHWGRGGNWMKEKGKGLKGVSFFNASQRKENNRTVSEISDIDEHDRVVLKTDLDFANLKAGETGTVVHIYPNAKAYEVEFSNPTHTIVTVLKNQIKKIK